ncbi:YveK family protein [Cohnella zeiphila]|uniref:Polysaccharide chain length determinant N-terminal domain-containing protein n=1 Tax=Cohnella zeiphila TaxID=2761120 RepID=A0A7X0SNC7_9BACL|nr:Wzz/FepE/Etk N-terminal domain-containing protein [Cohnella zeiphila]MBB6733069.1 hypothetical protein [Cohnella zeiphila]
MGFQILNSIRKHMITFALTVICFVAIGFGLNTVMSPQYEAKATLVANFAPTDSNSDNKYNEILANQMLTKSYEEMIQSLYIAQIVKTDLSSSLSVTELLSKIQVKTDPGALLLSIYVRDGTPKGAVDIANAFAQSFADHAATIMNNANVTILDLASYENSLDPVSPQKTFNLAICLFIGMFAGSSFSLLLDKRKAVRTKKAAAYVLNS